MQLFATLLVITGDELPKAIIANLDAYSSDVLI